MLLEVRQVGPLGLLLRQECHKGRKAKAENEKRKRAPEEKGPGGLRLSALQTSCLIEISDTKVLTQASRASCRKSGLQLRWRPQLVLHWSGRQWVSWFCVSSVTNGLDVWESLIFKSQRKCLKTFLMWHVFPWICSERFLARCFKWNIFF